MASGGKQQDGTKMQSHKPPSNISAFLSKLWRMVNDSDVDQLISWNDTGSCFVIQNQHQFWAKLLPLYYKHNNMSSFVRQLNMYGFHKVSSELGLPDSDLQFYHEYFQRDKPDLLEQIKRKVAVPRAAVPPTALAAASLIVADLIGSSAPRVNTAPADPINIDKEDLARVLTDVKDLQGRQSSFNNQLALLKHENSVLWSELAMLRQRHTKQQAIVNKLIHFLVTLVQTPNPANRMGVKRTFPLMIDHDTVLKKSKTAERRRARAQSLRIHELDPTIGEAIDEDSVHTLDTVTSQHSAPNTPTKTMHEFSPNEFLHSPEPRDNGNMDIEDVVINESSALVDELLDTDDNEIIVLPSEIKSPCGTDIPSTSNTEFVAYVDENSSDDGEFFLNPTASNKLITNLMNGSYNSSAITDTLRSKLAAAASGSSSASTTMPFANTYSTLFPSTMSETVATSSMDISSAACPSSGTADKLAVATMTKPPKPSRLKSVVGDELGQHVKDTQSELDCFKDIIYGSGSMDLNYLLGLFSEDAPFKLVPQQPDPSMSNSISTYEPIGSPIDFTELINAINSDTDPLLPICIEEENTVAATASDSSFINTPLIFDGSPIFPIFTSSKK